MLARVWGKENYQILLVGVQTGVDIIEITASELCYIGSTTF